MKRYILILFLLICTPLHADLITGDTTYTTGDTVTATKLNNDNTVVKNQVNGNLNNANAKTGSGFRFYESLGSLPTAATEGRMVYDAGNNNLSIDSGSAWLGLPTYSGTVAQGDVLYYNGSAWTLLTAGTDGQALKTNGAAANPAWEDSISIASQAQGDVLYYNGSAWTRLGVGTSGTFLKTNGAASNPAWAGAFSSITDYATSTSSGTTKYSADMHVVYGTATVGASSTQAITNLPFSSATSFVAFPCSETLTVYTGQPQINRDSGSQITIRNTQAVEIAIMWVAIGT